MRKEIGRNKLNHNFHPEYIPQDSKAGYFINRKVEGKPGVLNKIREFFIGGMGKD